MAKYGLVWLWIAFYHEITHSTLPHHKQPSVVILTYQENIPTIYKMKKANMYLLLYVFFSFSFPKCNTAGGAVVLYVNS